jgi:GT2 family glycosyltransferase
MVSRLISQLLDFPEVGQIILTKNIPETLVIQHSQKLLILDNVRTVGFGKNHNTAFKFAAGKFFCVLNPDVIFLCNPFVSLLDHFEDADVSLVAPRVTNSAGDEEDSMRYFPTPLSITKKLLLGEKGRYYITESSPMFYPEWVAGMFMLFKSRIFSKIGGFDECFYLYYEDVDICIRIWKMGGVIIGVPEVAIIHNAQRASRSNIQHLNWHIRSMLRYFIKHLWRFPRVMQI